MGNWSDVFDYVIAYSLLNAGQQHRPADELRMRVEVRLHARPDAHHVQPSRLGLENPVNAPREILQHTAVYGHCILWRHSAVHVRLHTLWHHQNWNQFL